MCPSCKGTIAYDTGVTGIWKTYQSGMTWGNISLIIPVPAWYGTWGSSRYRTVFYTTSTNRYVPGFLSLPDARHKWALDLIWVQDWYESLLKLVPNTSKYLPGIKGEKKPHIRTSLVYIYVPKLITDQHWNIPWMLCSQILASTSPYNPPEHHERWMVSGEENTICWIPVFSLVNIGS